MEKYGVLHGSFTELDSAVYLRILYFILQYRLNQSQYKQLNQTQLDLYTNGQSQ